MKMAPFILLAAAASLATLLCTLLTWYSLMEHSGWGWVLGYAFGAVGGLYLMERMLKKIVRGMR